MLNASAVAGFCKNTVLDFLRNTPVLKQLVEKEVKKQVEDILNKRLVALEQKLELVENQLHVRTMEKCYMEMYIESHIQEGERFNLPNFNTLETVVNTDSLCPTPALIRPPSRLPQAFAVPIPSFEDPCPAPPRLRPPPPGMGHQW